MADNRAALHQGQATERNTKSASARVGYDDLSGTVSASMQVLFPAAGGWNFFYTPKEGDQVVTSRLPNGAEEGYILGKVYTAGKMPQGGADNIILLVSDDGKNVVRFDADKGTLDLVVDQGGSLKFKNLGIEVKEYTGLTTKDLGIEVEKQTSLATEDLDVEAIKHAGLKAGELDVESLKPIGFQGTGTQLGTGVLVTFFTALKAAVTSNPVIIPPVPLPPGVPVPPAPPMINMFLRTVTTAIALACDAAIASCKLVLK
jgi:phage baseplate assembly protein gpV